MLKQKQSLLKSSHREVFCKKGVLKNSRNSEENVYATVSLLEKVAG